MVLDPDIAAVLRRDGAGLVCAVVQDASSGRVLMVGWMDDDALERTLRTGLATFFSRSRGRQWVKGEESGHVLRVQQVQRDCDGDALLVLAEPAGPTCHTGRTSCFDSGELPLTVTTTPAAAS